VRDARMIERRKQLRFLLESRAARRIHGHRLG
jgi:hypothetical protein